MSVIAFRAYTLNKCIRMSPSCPLRPSEKRLGVRNTRCFKTSQIIKSHLLVWNAGIEDKVKIFQGRRICRKHLTSLTLLMFLQSCFFTVFLLLPQLKTIQTILGIPHFLLVINHLFSIDLNFYWLLGFLKSFTKK